MSELFSLALNDPKTSLLHFIVPVLVIVVLEIISAIVSLKNKRIRKFLEGTTQYIIYNGKINYQVLKKNRYNINDLMLQLRNKEIQSPLEVEFAILEGNGNLNIIKKQDAIVLFPEPLIVDGKINYEALNILQYNENNLLADLSKQGFNSPEQIFFAQMLKQGLYVIPFEDIANH